jgi:hypothetical protein
MFIATNNPSKYSRSARSEICFRLAGASIPLRSYGRETSSVTSGYKHLAPAGEKFRQRQFVALPS